MDIALDRHLLSLSVDWAVRSYDDNCTPVGAVLATLDGEIYGQTRSYTRNTEINRTSALLHAEIVLLMECQGRLRPDVSTSLYVSFEPCHMCMGAAMLSRIKRIVWATDDYWGGASRLYEWGHKYIQMRMPELVRTPFPDLQKKSADLWVNWQTKNDMPMYIERMLHWQARIET